MRSLLVHLSALAIMAFSAALFVLGFPLMIAGVFGHVLADDAMALIKYASRVLDTERE